MRTKTLSPKHAFDSEIQVKVTICIIIGAMDAIHWLAEMEENNMFHLGQAAGQ